MPTSQPWGIKLSNRVLRARQMKERAEVLPYVKQKSNHCKSVVPNVACLPLQLDFPRAGGETMAPLEVAGRRPARRPVRPDSRRRCRSLKAGRTWRHRAPPRSDGLALCASSWTGRKQDENYQPMIFSTPLARPGW